jgi:predicted transcriptional regulator of viral defense system
VGSLTVDMRRSITPPDARLADLAARQYGVVSVRQLRALGIDDAAVRRRVASGRLHRLYRGVYAVGHTVLTGHARWLAATMATGGVLSHRSAAALWDIRPTAAARVDVTVSHTSGVRSTTAIVVHRPRRPPETTTQEGIPVTTPGQTLADLATALPRRALEKAAESAEARRLDVVVPDGHSGAKRLAEAMAHDLTHTTRSPLEDAFLELCDAHGIPRPLVNTVIAGFEVDFCWPEQRLIVETDGRAHHGTRAAFERDRARDARLTALGWRVMRFTDRQVRTEAPSVAAVVVRARDAAALEPGDRALVLGERAAVEPDPLRDPDLGGVEVRRVVELGLGRPAERVRQLGLPELHGVAAAAEQSHRA